MLRHPKEASLRLMPESLSPLRCSQVYTLKNQGYTQSLAEAIRSKDLTIWIIDNSSSMKTRDGHRIQDVVDPSNGQNSVKITDCDRWGELCSCIESHIHLAALLEAPARFRLLNKSYPAIYASTFSIGEQDQGSMTKQDRIVEVFNALDIMRAAEPGGSTPLTRHLLEIRRQICKIQPQLRQEHRNVCITIATDGLPTSDYGEDGQAWQDEFVETLRSLESLSVSVVVRLCTDDEQVVKFYSHLPRVLSNLPLDIIRDFHGEAREVFAKNPWINYTTSIHRVREMGHHGGLLSLLDERPLTRSEVRDVCRMLFGQAALESAPDPTKNWKGFLKVVEDLAEAAPKQWNPIKRKPKKLVSVKKLARVDSR